MAKRANGEGNIRKRKDGKWLVTFPTGLYKDNGKREYVYRYTDTQAEARKVLDKLKAEQAGGVSLGEGATKAVDWIEYWIEKLKAPKLAPATLTSYRNNFRLHIKNQLGKTALRSLHGRGLRGFPHVHF